MAILDTIALKSNEIPPSGSEAILRGGKLVIDLQNVGQGEASTGVLSGSTPPKAIESPEYLHNHLKKETGEQVDSPKILRYVETIASRVGLEENRDAVNRAYKTLCEHNVSEKEWKNLYSTALTRDVLLSDYIGLIKGLPFATMTLINGLWVSQLLDQAFHVDSDSGDAIAPAIVGKVAGKNALQGVMLGLADHWWQRTVAPALNNLYYLDPPSNQLPQEIATLPKNGGPDPLPAALAMSFTERNIGCDLLSASMIALNASPAAVKSAGVITESAFGLLAGAKMRATLDGISINHHEATLMFRNDLEQLIPLLRSTCLGWRNVGRGAAHVLNVPKQVLTRGASSLGHILKSPQTWKGAAILGTGLGLTGAVQHMMNSGLGATPAPSATNQPSNGNAWADLLTRSLVTTFKFPIYYWFGSVGKSKPAALQSPAVEEERAQSKSAALQSPIVEEERAQSKLAALHSPTVEEERAYRELEKMMFIELSAL